MARETRRISHILWLSVAWLSVAAACMGFVLPWAHLDVRYQHITRLPGQVSKTVDGTPFEKLFARATQDVERVTIRVARGTETVVGELPRLSDIPTQVSGMQVPQFANRQDAQVVLALAELFTGQRDLGVKSYTVYLLPGLALLCGVLITLVHQRVTRLVLGALCLALAGGGFVKLLTTNTSTLLVSITIGQGLWWSLGAYVGLGIAAIVLARAPLN